MLPLSCASPKNKICKKICSSLVPKAFGVWFFVFFFAVSHITVRMDSLRMILWMASTMRKSPLSFLVMLTAYPGQIWRLCPEGKRPEFNQSGQGAPRTQGFISTPHNS